MLPPDIVAIVGQGCILPGALSPDALWSLAAEGGSGIGDARDEDWGARVEAVLSSPDAGLQPDRTWSARCGLVRGFDDACLPPIDTLFDGSALPPRPDPVLQWSLAAAAQAHAGLVDAGTGRGDRAGLIMGNLSYPTRGHNRWVAGRLLAPHIGDELAGDPRDRFNSGLPAILLARALGLAGGGFALDAACASGLYAIKLACDRLRLGHWDYALAGAVNAADPLYLQVGFCALSALSRSGRSLPFRQDADGLVPAEGAAFVGLKRLADALDHGDRILGVIHGIGLSNDGRAGGFLSPDVDGQERAIRAALADAEHVAAADVHLVECHATGTPTGDRRELASAARCYGPGTKLAGLKANIGHTITASGAAALVRGLGALARELVPGTPQEGPLVEEIEAHGFELPPAPTAWRGAPLFAVSSFGFGGNNAHMIVGAYEPASAPAAGKRPRTPAALPRLAVVGCAVRTTHSETTAQFLAALAGEGQGVDKRTSTFDAARLAFPPADLRRALGQQLLLLECAEALRAENVDGARTGVFIGMGTDTEIGRHSLRLRLETYLPALDAATRARALEALGDPLDAADVIGKMPNVPANRLGNQYDLRGPGFVLSREELSGIVALETATLALHLEEIDEAWVGAVDLSLENAHQAAVEALLPDDRARPLDAAVLLRVKTEARARSDGDPILATLDRISDDAGAPISWRAPTRPLGHAHAASGLLDLAAALELLALRRTPGGEPVLPGRDGQARVVQCSSGFEDATATYAVRARARRPENPDAPRIWCFSAPDRDALLERLRTGIQAAPQARDRCRLALVCRAAELAERLAGAVEALAEGRLRDGWRFGDVFFREQPVAGETAFVFTGAAAAYSRMGRGLMLAFPDIIDRHAPAVGDLEGAMGWAFEQPARTPTLQEQLTGVTALCQTHAFVSRELLGLRPQAAIGLSSGETNALFALGAWRDIDGLYRGIGTSRLYESELAGTFEAVRRAWGESGPVAWTNLRVLAPVDAVRRAIEGRERVYLSIIYSAADCVIGGDPSACRAVLEALGDPPAMDQKQGLAVHCAALEPFADTWRALHTRATHAVPGVRFYSHHFGASYETTPERVAEALTGQALGTVDFPAVIEQAYADGVRVFVEHGPRNTLASSIATILGDRPHLAVALDAERVDGLVQLERAASELWCAGVDVNLDALRGELPAAQPASAITLSFDLHAPALELPLPRYRYHPPALRAGPEAGQLLQEAPALARITVPHPDDGSGSVQPERFDAASSALADAPVASTPRRQPAAPAPAPPAQRHQAVAAAPAKVSAPAPVVHPEAPRPRPAAGAGTESLLARGHDRMLAAHHAFLDAQREGLAAYGATLSRMQTALFGGAPGVEYPQPAEAAAVLPAEVPVAGAVPALPVPVAPRTAPPLFDRAALETLAGGSISSVFGPAFAEQDAFAVQVRMPEPPLLLCDRVLAIEGEARSMGTGTIWTETDVPADAWYLFRGRMPPGICIECGQADLLLISWLGVDFHNRGERAYRLLGCELVFHGDLPEPGETLEYEIHVDGHARQGDVRLFFFHYDCYVGGELRVSVRNGQAGFFSPQELAESSGVLWDPATADYSANGRVDAAPVPTTRDAFDADAMAAFLRGDLRTCFGAGFERSATHSRTPGVPDGALRFIDRVVELDLTGGPAGRGYLRAETDLRGDEWFFPGHFKNDPCMPGTLMADATLQTMAFYLSALGCSLARDGWRFQPMADVTYKFVCRGQVTPASRHLTYEVFVDEFIDGDQPTLFAHVLCSVDGRKAFLCERLGLQLVPDWPIEQWEPLDPAQPDLNATQLDGLRLDQDSLLHCALGRPSLAFGPRFEHLDRAVRSPRLPRPPYHFMTRIRSLSGEMFSMAEGASLVAEYDVPPDAWYFDEHVRPVMPVAVLMEIALQPCGWLASFLLAEELAKEVPFFRNLDGNARQLATVDAGVGIVRTQVQVTRVAAVSGITLFGFDVTCTDDSGRILVALTTDFGYFPGAALTQQRGLKVTDAERALLALPARPVEEAALPATSTRRLRLFDRVTGIWSAGGGAGLGAIRAERDIDASDWYFRAHFFQDPVQPGSLGVDALFQLAEVLLSVEGGCAIAQAPALDEEIEWHYRGQVTPERSRVVLDVEVVERSGDLVICAGRLWVEDIKIYEVPRMPLRIEGSGAA